MPRLVLTIAVLGLGCGDPASPPGEASLEVVSAPATGRLGRELPDLVVLRARGEDGTPIPGITVQWEAWDGGSVEPIGEATGLDGLVAARWRLGFVDERQTLRASIHGSPALNLTVDAPLFRADKVDAGYVLGCAIASEELWCFGDGWPMELFTDAPQPGYVPVRVLPDIRASDLAVSDGAVCVVDTQGAVRCAGQGFGSAGSSGFPIGGIPPATAIAAGDSWFCAVANDGSAWCWRPPGAAARVPGSVMFRSIAVGGGAFFACGQDIAGATWCWGNGLLGQLGNGAFESSDTPVPVSGVSAFQVISAGVAHACGTVGAQIHCWGSNETLRLTPAAANVATPVLRTEVSGSVRTAYLGGLALGPGSTTLWGIGGRSLQSLQSIPGFERLVFKDASGDDSACGLTPGGAVYCLNLSGFDNPGQWFAIPAPAP